MRDILLVGIAAVAVATITACSEADREQIKNHASEVIETAGQAAETAINKADEAVDTMDDMADQVMFSDSADDALAIATLSAVNSSGVSGRITFSKVIDGMEVRAAVSGLSPGEHAVHIHENGDCSNNARAAGSNLRLSADRAGEIHGNLGEFTSADNGTDTELTVLHVPISEIMGKAVVVHADGNDPDQSPSGGAGARVACGLIEPPSDSGNATTPPPESTG